MAGNKIYIAGKISGTTDYIERFEAAEEYLSHLGWEGRIVNPAKISADLPPESTTYAEYINAGLFLLSECSNIYMLYGWEKSPGACLEFTYAKTLGYGIYYEGRM